MNKKSKPLIFLTNDDGVSSPGLMALASVVEKFADIEIIAPSNQMTAAGRGLFGERETQLQTSEIEINDKVISAYHAPISPAQVVMQGVQILAGKQKPDLLISGINYGENLGRDISMSGTIGAAFQAASMGLPALAVSLQTPIHYHYEHGDMDWEIAAFFAEKFAKKMLDRVFPDDVDVLKLDIPQNASKETPWKVTKVGRMSNFLAQIPSPNSNSTLREAKITINPDFIHADKDSDVYTVHAEKIVSVSPISLDFTSRVDLNKLHDFLENGTGNWEKN